MRINLDDFAKPVVSELPEGTVGVLYKEEIQLSKEPTDVTIYPKTPVEDFNFSLNSNKINISFIPITEERLEISIETLQSIGLYSENVYININKNDEDVIEDTNPSTVDVATNTEEIN